MCLTLFLDFLKYWKILLRLYPILVRNFFPFRKIKILEFLPGSDHVFLENYKNNFMTTYSFFFSNNSLLTLMVDIMTVPAALSTNKKATKCPHGI